MKRILPALVCGFGAGVLNTVPLVKAFSCCLIIPVAAIISILLDQKATGIKELIKPGKAIQLGLLTGLFAALFGTLFEVLIIYVTKTSELAAGLPAIEEMMSRVSPGDISREMMNILYKINDDITHYGFSALFTFYMLSSSLIVNTIMGMLGGLMGMQLINNRMKREQ